MEIAAVILVVAAALAFVAWRVVVTVRVARGGQECGGCGSCRPAEAPGRN
ncbi:MAG: hypothetical protein KF754_09220 [Planctomycetes bacterium]|nr:hypothetical protein [Planctomycetota bacterium]